MTRDEFLNFLKTDPIFNMADKQVVATLYESPFDNAVFDIQTGSMTLTFHGEEFTFEMGDSDLAEIMQGNPYLGIIITAKRVVINAGFREFEGDRYIDANGEDITQSAAIPFTASEDNGGGGNGGLG